MARDVGWASHSAANLHYGRLAEKVKRGLNCSTGESVTIKMFVEFVDPGERGNTEILWIMRPQLAQALEDLGWVSNG
jgi:hypothetical protein